MSGFSGVSYSGLDYHTYNACNLLCHVIFKFAKGIKTIWLHKAIVLKNSGYFKFLRSRNFGKTSKFEWGLTAIYSERWISSFVSYWGVHIVNLLANFLGIRSTPNSWHTINVKLNLPNPAREYVDAEHTAWYHSFIKPAEGNDILTPQT